VLLTRNIADTNITSNYRARLDAHVIQSTRHGSCPDRACVAACDSYDDGMRVWLGEEQDGQDPCHPVTACGRECLQRNEQWQHPHLRNRGEQEPFIELLREPGEDK